MKHLLDRQATPSPPNRFEEQSQDLTPQPGDTLFRALLESGPDAILVVDGAGKISLANRRTVELFGYEEDELVGKSIGDARARGAAASTWA